MISPSENQITLKRVENTVGKGEIARDEQFLLFPQCFQKACFPGASKGVIVWEWVRRENLCSNDTLGTRNILQTTDIRRIQKNLTMLKKEKNRDWR